jgi:putative spermidine/putrescine transport system ATP-binding protein
MTTPAAEIELDHLAKRYGATVAVHEVSLSLAKGEMLALLGPSGCGKTTTLRMIAGFVEPTGGRVLLRGEDITGRPPYRRDTGMVFQNYALFPHLTVTGNIAFGLERRGIARDEIRRRCTQMIAMMRLDGLEERLPQRLSGGQQQRVAVARALVINPTVLLLDEPFSNLDAKLRESTRVELRRIQQSLGLTSIFVTHDQHEAMAIADRIAVMDGGRVVQIGSAADIYERPATRFVAEFIGQASFIDGEVVGLSLAGEVIFESGPGLRISVPGNRCDPDLEAGARCTLMIRPEAMTLCGSQKQDPAQPLISLSDSATADILSGKVDHRSFQGPFVHLELQLAGGQRLLVEHRTEHGPAPARGENVNARVRPESLRVFAHS